MQERSDTKLSVEEERVQLWDGETTVFSSGTKIYIYIKITVCQCQKPLKIAFTLFFFLKKSTNWKAFCFVTKKKKSDSWCLHCNHNKTLPNPACYLQGVWKKKKKKSGTNESQTRYTFVFIIYTFTLTHAFPQLLLSWFFVDSAQHIRINIFPQDIPIGTWLFQQRVD